MVPISDVPFLATKPPRPKPPPSTIKSRLNSDNGTSSRSRPAGGIPTRNVSASMSAETNIDTKISSSPSLMDRRSRSSSGIPRPHSSKLSIG
ncbi:unnamed protein product, partial [Rotaria magnacalcarata]